MNNSTKFLSKEKIEKINLLSKEFYDDKDLRKQKGIIFHNKKTKKILLIDGYVSLDIYRYRDKNTNKVFTYKVENFEYLYKFNIDITLLKLYVELRYVLNTTALHKLTVIPKIDYRMIDYYLKKHPELFEVFNWVKVETTPLNVLFTPCVYFINIDDTFKIVRKNSKTSKMRFRVINIEQKGIKTQLTVAVATRVNDFNINSKQTHKLIENILEEHFNYDKNNSKIYLFCDGARIFKNMCVNNNFTLIYDWYHLKKYFLNIFSYDKRWKSSKNYKRWTYLGQYINYNEIFKQILNALEVQDYDILLKIISELLNKIKELKSEILFYDLIKAYNFLLKTPELKSHFENRTAKAESIISKFKTDCFNKKGCASLNNIKFKLKFKCSKNNFYKLYDEEKIKEILKLR